MKPCSDICGGLLELMNLKFCPYNPIEDLPGQYPLDFEFEDGITLRPCRYAYKTDEELLEVYTKQLLGKVYS
jgi:hypothetical protein